MRDKLYAFAFRGLLTQETLDKSGIISKHSANSILDQDLVSRVSLDILDEDLVTRASRMATVYTAIAALENSTRHFVGNCLLEELGENWWEKGVSEKVRKKA